MIRHIILQKRFSFITACKRSLGQGNIFSSVCQEFCSQEGVPGQVHPPPQQVHPRAGTPLRAGTPPPQGRYTPLGRYPPRAVHAGKYGQQAGGTHPTGMHSCLKLFSAVACASTYHSLIMVVATL